MGSMVKQQQQHNTTQQQQDKHNHINKYIGRYKNDNTTRRTASRTFRFA